MKDEIEKLLDRLQEQYLRREQDQEIRKMLEEVAERYFMRRCKTER